MTNTIGDQPTSRYARLVGWLAATFVILLLLAGWQVWKMLSSGLAGHENVPHGPETRHAVQKSKTVADLLSKANADGELTDSEIRNSLDGGELLDLTRGFGGVRLTVGFPYTYTQPQDPEEHQGCLRVDYDAREGKRVEEHFWGMTCPQGGVVH